MTIFDDPNREAVGLDPIWTDAENPPIPDPDPPVTTTAKATPKATTKPDDDDEGKATT